MVDLFRGCSERRFTSDFSLFFQPISDHSGEFSGEIQQLHHLKTTLQKVDVFRVDSHGRDLLVAVIFGLTASEAIAERRSSYQIKRWEAYTNLYKKVSDEWWFEPGHGDWCTFLEKYTLCRYGIYHKKDQFQWLFPTFIQVIELTKWEEAEYWGVVSDVFEGKPIDSTVSNSIIEERPSFTSNSSLLDTGINNKVQLLRTMLQWEEQLRIAGLKQFTRRKSASLGEVAIIEKIKCWIKAVKSNFCEFYNEPQSVIWTW